MLVYANGVWLEAEKAVIPFSDQGFLYGDSLFETFRINHGIPFRPEKHLERLASGMQTIRMDGQEMLARIPALLAAFIEKNGISHALVKIMITRGALLPEDQTELAIYISGRALPEISEGPEKVIFFDEKNYPILRFYPAIKSGNYLGNMLAKKDAEAAGAFEPVFVNQDQHITECAIRNIFFIKDGVLLTPTVKLGVLPGVIRDTIMELALKRGMEVRESYILKQDVDGMDEAFISSTGVGVLPVFWDGFSSSYAHSRILKNDLQQLFESGASNVT